MMDDGVFAVDRLYLAGFNGEEIFAQMPDPMNQEREE